MNEYLRCLESDAEFEAFRAAWPRVPGVPGASVHAGWLIRVCDAAVKGDPALRRELEALRARVASSALAPAAADASDLLDALGTGELCEADCRRACELMALSFEGSTARQQLLAVFLVTSALWASAARNRLD